MADFSALKTAIQNAIRTNGNNEITGQLLQDILLSMVVVLGDEAITNVADDLSTETSQRQNADGTLQGNINGEATARATADAALQNAINTINSNFSNGYVYAGIATPSATPATGKVFYIATTAGTYTNFGGLTVTKGINILKYNGSSWSQEQIIGIDDYPTAGSSKLALSGGVDAEIKSLVGYYTCGTAAATAAKTITASAYILLQGGSIKVKFTYKNTAADATLKIGSADAKPLFYGGRRAGSSNSWEAGEVVEIFYDGTNYMANNVMGGGAGDGAFDISVYNAVDGTPTPYTDLAAALGTNGANIPDTLRKGGMSVKFVQSSDNKYVQYRLMSDSFNTTVANWQGVDDIMYYTNPIWKIGNINIRNTGWIWKTDPNRVCVEFPIRLRKGDVIYLTDYTDARMFIGWQKNDGTYGLNGWKTSGVFTCPDDGDYVINLANVNEVSKTSYKELANLCIIERQSLELQKKMEDYSNSVSLNNSGDLMAYKNLWKVQNINIANGIPWSWNADNTRVSTQFPIKLEKGQTISLYDYTGVKLYIGWRTIAGEYKRTGYWLTSGYFVCPEDGYYVFNIATDPATDQSEPYTLANLLHIESLYDYVEHFTNNELQSAHITASGNSGSLHADFVVINEFTSSGYYSSIFYGNQVFCLFHKNEGHIYIKIGDKRISYSNQVITIGKRYVIDISWNNGNYIISVNGEEKTGTYTTEITGSYWFGDGAADTHCVSAIIKSVKIDNVEYVDIVKDHLELYKYVEAVQNYINSVDVKADKNTSDIISIQNEIDNINISNAIFNPLRNKPFYAHYHVDGFMQDGEGHNIIANSSLEEIKAAARLGFDYVELKPKITSDGVYINMHGHSGMFAASVYALNGDDIYNTPINSVTLDYIRTNVRYNSHIEKYRTTIPTLEECLQCCKEYNIGAFVEAINVDLVNICRQYLDDSSLILYSPPTNIRQTTGFSGLIFDWFNSNTYTKESIIARAELYGTPFMAGIGGNTISGLGDNGLKELIKGLHDKNCIIGFASHGVSLQKYFRFGGDACAAGYEVNPFESNKEVIDINGDSSQFNTTGTLSNGVFMLNDGDTIICGSDEVLPLGKASLKLRFNGEVKISFGYISNVDVVSDGNNVYFDSTYLLNNKAKLTITSVGDTTITDLIFKSSKC